MIENEDYKTLKKFLIALGFENYESSDKISKWQHKTKLITFHSNENLIKQNSINHLIKKFLKLVRDNFSLDELQFLLAPFFKKNKISFNKRCKEKILRIDTNNEVQLETRILNYLLVKKIKNFHFEYSTPIEINQRLSDKVKKRFEKNLEKEIKTNFKLTK